MPIYEYRCQACGAEEEILQKMSDPKPTSCSKCGKGPMDKLMPSSTSFALKGTGWYVTDFRGGSSKKPESTAKDDSSSSDLAKLGDSTPSPAATTPAAAAPAVATAPKKEP